MKTKIIYYVLFALVIAVNIGFKDLSQSIHIASLPACFMLMGVKSRFDIMGCGNDLVLLGISAFNVYMLV